MKTCRPEICFELGNRDEIVRLVILGIGCQGIRLLFVQRCVQWEGRAGSLSLSLSLPSLLGLHLVSVTDLNLFKLNQVTERKEERKKVGYIGQ